MNNTLYGLNELKCQILAFLIGHLGPNTELWPKSTWHSLRDLDNGGFKPPVRASTWGDVLALGCSPT